MAPRKPTIPSKELRKEAIAAYGSKCACCSVGNYEFLCVDHTFGDGAEHRIGTKRRRLAGTPLLRWLRKNGYPKDRFRLLCWNCNMAMALYGQCPHGTLPPQQGRALSNPYRTATAASTVEMGSRIRRGMAEAKRAGVPVGRTRLNVDLTLVLQDRLAGMTLTQVADKWGISRATVCREQNKYRAFVSNPPKETLIQIEY